MKFLSNTVALYRCFTTKPFILFPQNALKKNKPVDFTTKKPVKVSFNFNKSKTKWTQEQTLVLTAISEGKSVFLTGSAGTGKTFLLTEIIKMLKKIYGRNRVSITSSTGLSACALNGQTLHSFAGVGLGEGDREAMLLRVFSNAKAIKRWNEVDAMVIDEISMVDAEFFDKLEFIAREVRGRGDVPWGGLQLVVTGDFFQLPPISGYEKKRGMNFAFKAECWGLSFDLQVEVTRVFRQSEANLIKLLQGVRIGECDSESVKLLEQYCVNKEPDRLAVQIFPRNDDVSRVNLKHLDSLNNEIVVYRALDEGLASGKRLLGQGIVPDELNVCIGARVMLVRNLNQRKKLVNGATGTIVDFQKPDITEHTEFFISNEKLLPVVKFDSGEELLIGPEVLSVMENKRVIATRKQIPLILAWALSIHKCQGMSIDKLHTNLSRTFDYGMVYVALSRVKSLDGLHLSGFDPSKIKAHPDVLQFYHSFKCLPEN